MSRLPRWLKVPIPRGSRVRKVRDVLSELRLCTVCDEARCPNRGECYGSGTATFMILGDVCTRACRFCAVARGTPEAPDATEPGRVAEAVRRLGLRHVVVTSVTRDDLPDGGASLFAAVVRAVRSAAPDCTIEILVPDFAGSSSALETVLDARPDVLNHNVETVPRLYGRVRPQADYVRSLDLLAAAKRLAPETFTKSGFMVGLGETWAEVFALLRDLREAGVDAVTAGQYLRPAPGRLDVVRFRHPEEFEHLRRAAESLGLTAACGPLVRSSHGAGAMLERLRSRRR